MRVDKKYEELISKFTLINYSYDTVKRAFQTEVDALRNINADCRFFTGSALGYRDPFSGKLTKIDTVSYENSVEDLMRDAWQRKNRQYCWLLVDYFETFYSFIKVAFEYKYKKINGRKPDKKGLKAIFDYFSFSEFDAENCANYPHIPCRLALELIGLLRNYIAHEAGVVRDVNNFLDKLISNSGLGRDYVLKYRDSILVFVSDGSVDLSEVKINSRLTGHHYDLLGNMKSIMIAYALYVERDIRLFNKDVSLINSGKIRPL